MKKAVKYKQIAKHLKISLDSITSQVHHIKEISQEEIKNLQQSVQILEKVIN